MSLLSRTKRVVLVLVSGLTFALVAACSKQGEGERCDHINAGDGDCDEGLRCVYFATVQVARCCPPENAQISDDRCDPTQLPTGGTGGSGGSGGSSGGVSAGGVSAGGTDAGTGGTAMSGAGGQPTETPGGAAGETSGGASGE